MSEDAENTGKEQGVGVIQQAFDILRLSNYPSDDVVAPYVAKLRGNNAGMSDAGSCAANNNGNNNNYAFSRSSSGGACRTGSYVTVTDMSGYNNNNNNLTKRSMTVTDMSGYNNSNNNLTRRSMTDVHESTKGVPTHSNNKTKGNKDANNEDLSDKNSIIQGYMGRAYSAGENKPWLTRLWLFHENWRQKSPIMIAWKNMALHPAMDIIMSGVIMCGVCMYLRMYVSSRSRHNATKTHT